MKEEYASPLLEKIEFSYENQVVASGPKPCTKQWTNIGDTQCSEWNTSWFDNQSF